MFSISNFPDEFLMLSFVWHAFSCWIMLLQLRLPVSYSTGLLRAVKSEAADLIRFADFFKMTFTVSPFLSMYSISAEPMFCLVSHLENHG